MANSVVWPPKLFYHWHPVLKVLPPTSVGWHFVIWGGQEVTVPNLGDGKGFAPCVGKRPDDKLACDRCGWQATFLRLNKESGEWNEITIIGE